MKSIFIVLFSILFLITAFLMMSTTVFAKDSGLLAFQGLNSFLAKSPVISAQETIHSIYVNSDKQILANGPATYQGRNTYDKIDHNPYTLSAQRHIRLSGGFKALKYPSDAIYNLRNKSFNL